MGADAFTYNRLEVIGSSGAVRQFVDDVRGQGAVLDFARHVPDPALWTSASNADTWLAVHVPGSSVASYLFGVEGDAPIGWVLRTSIANPGLSFVLSSAPEHGDGAGRTVVAGGVEVHSAALEPHELDWIATARSLRPGG